MQHSTDAIRVLHMGFFIVVLGFFIGVSAAAT
jgi:hypothetical protein